MTSARDYLEQFANLDLGRAARSGVPEVVLAEHKTAEQTIAIARRILDTVGRVLISRVSPETRLALQAAFADTVEWTVYSGGRTLTLNRPGVTPPRHGGRVGVLTAGTGDLPVAEEAIALCIEMGCDIWRASDVGVAGLHRLFEPLRAMLDASVDVIIVAAGMDGALPSVVAGLVDVPVIGLPTSIGYGFGGGGVGALTSMLQTCAPGLAVVNIDNGIGAGAIAGRIANRAAAARRR
ncbi:MAG: nickel pincer cofactor biosynthesis protein LarB [Roseiflexus sp.]|nr:nickel pincer cofactor biosynthesis protein LarB [Roseiflexus sp.]MCS7288940.1 nickel pincer cofactor biosynthesis protein LarB [Roseiflexus sp.]MDW8147149.1 nickel pincer cofactor biosynthesis protein LarB [Roseiflexaceae bacterium]MDW8231664.1 nickel pincer cofactor biosynthesis protein LarB [Roseiflexaceae bacterium]